MADVDYTPSTTAVRGNYRVVVEAVEDRWIRAEADPHRKKMAQLEQIKREILRHVDDINSAVVAYDTETVCSFCGYRWDWAVDDDGAPGCCGKAVSDYEAQTGRQVI